MTNDLLALQDVHTYIAGSHILQGVTFDVTAEEVTVLLGRNGAGKSTTLRTVMGILAATSGSIRLRPEGSSHGGGAVNGQAEELRGKPSYAIARQGVGFVPEDRDVFVSLTVEENLKLAQRPGTPRALPAWVSSRGPVDIEQAYTLFPDLRAARHRSAGALSGGQQQMLAIARALVNRNRVVLVDEPTKGLAPVIVKHLQSIFQSLREAGETILLVEQNLEFAQAVGDRFFVLDEGRIVHGGRMDELNREPELLRRYIGV